MNAARLKSQRDFYAGLMFAAIGAIFAWSATSYSFGVSAQPGPGYFPFGLGVLLAVLGIVVILKALTVESEEDERIGALAWRPLLVIVASVALFGITLPWLGLVVALPLLNIGAGWAGDEFRWKDALIAAAVLTLASWIIFILGLRLTIPLWPSFLVIA